MKIKKVFNLKELYYFEIIIIIILFIYFFIRPTDPTFRGGGRWETKHFIGMALWKKNSERWLVDRSAVILYFSAEKCKSVKLQKVGKLQQNIWKSSKLSKLACETRLGILLHKMFPRPRYANIQKIFRKCLVDDRKLQIFESNRRIFRFTQKVIRNVESVQKIFRGVRKIFDNVRVWNRKSLGNFGNVEKICEIIRKLPKEFENSANI